MVIDFAKKSQRWECGVEFRAGLLAFAIGFNVTSVLTEFAIAIPFVTFYVSRWRV